MSEITREEKYLAKLGGAEIEVPEPITRKEKFLAKATGATVEVPEPITREEMYLSKINSGGGGGYPEPTGSVTITENGTHDVKDKATAVVNVPNPSTGELSITQNGNYDVTDYASANVNVSGGGSSLNPITDARYLFFQNARVENFDVLIDALGQGIIANNMFYGATSIPWIENGVLTIPENKLRLAYSPEMGAMFGKISNIKEINGLSNITYSGRVKSTSGMFSNCSQLENITIPFDFQDVENCANMFSNCTNLKTIIFVQYAPYSATQNKYSSSLFQNCESLESVTFKGTNVFPITNVNAFTGVPTTCKFYVPSNLLNSYKTATNWSTIADQIFAIE